MSLQITLDPKNPTDLRNLATPTLAERIELHGTGTLKVCKLLFFNGDEEDMAHYKELIFTKSDFEGMDVLVPHKKFDLSDYAFCYLKVFAGKTSDTDHIYLFCKQEQVATEPS